MNYFYKCGISESKELIEKIKRLSNPPQDEKTFPECLIVQFIAAFSEEHPHEMKPPMFLQVLLSECCSQPTVQELRNNEQFRAIHSVKSDPNHARRAFDHFMEKIYGSPVLEQAITDWWNYSIENNQFKERIESIVPTTRDVSINDLSKLIVESSFFKLAVSLYIDVSNQINDPKLYFSFCRISQVGPTPSPLKTETDKIRLLYKFIKRYWLDNITLLKSGVTHKCEVFLKEYLDVDMAYLRVSEKEYQIERALNKLMSQPPEYLAQTRFRRSTTKMAARAHHFFKTQKLSSLGKMRLARFAYQAYSQEKNQLVLSVSQQIAIADLERLLPYNKSLEAKFSGNITISLHHLFEKTDMLSPEGIFDEFELKLSMEKEIGYKFSNYFEACCISLINQISLGYPLRKCSLCGRYYIAKQNRTKAENYCNRLSLENPYWTCSLFHSHFKSYYNGSANYNEIKKRVVNIRSYLAKMDPHIQYQDCIGILYSWLTTIRKYAKERDKDGNNMEIAMHLLDAIEKKRKQLSDETVRDSIITIGIDATIETLESALLSH